MKILVTRPAAQANITAKRLRERGLTPIISPMLAIEPVVCPPPAVDRISAIAITSANAAKRLAEFWPAENRNIPVHTTGLGSQKTLVDCGFTDVCAHIGDGGNLADAMMAQIDPAEGEAILYPCGETRRPEFEQRLRAAGFSIEAMVVYRAVGAKGFEPEAETALSEGTLGGALFYSSRTAATFAELYDGLNLDRAALPPLFCLSGRIAETLKATLCVQSTFSDRPDEENLLDLVEQHRQMQP